MAEAFVCGAANSASCIKIRGMETEVGGWWEAERELKKGLAGSVSQDIKRWMGLS